MNPPEFWIIDDDILYVRELVRALSEQLEGFTVIKFVTASPAITALAGGKKPAAVILDMMIAKDEWDNPIEWPPGTNPARNGIAIAEKLRECGVKPTVIGVITAVIDKVNLVPLEQAGVLQQNILIKPAETEKIRDLVRRITKEARATK